MTLHDVIERGGLLLESDVDDDNDDDDQVI